MSNVVYPKLLLKALSSNLSVWKCHDACVVNQDVQPIVFLVESVYKFLYRIQIIQIERNKVKITSTQLIHSFHRPFLGPASKNNFVWVKFY